MPIEWTPLRLIVPTKITVVVDEYDNIRLQQGDPENEPEAVVTIDRNQVASIIAVLEKALTIDEPGPVSQVPSGRGHQ